MKNCASREKFEDSLETNELLLLFDNVGAGAGALLCPLRTIEIGPFSRVAESGENSSETVRQTSQINLPGFCLATAENAIGAVGSIVDGDWMLLLLVLF